MYPESGSVDTYVPCSCYMKNNVTTLVHAIFVILQDKRNGILETQLFIRRTKASSFRTYTVVADNGIGVAKNDVELVRGTSINGHTVYNTGICITFLSLEIISGSLWTSLDHHLQYCLL